jgi:hypothetical protein
MKDEKIFTELPCQNCGKLVTVALPFVGCVFCSDCWEPSFITADAPEFKPRYDWADNELHPRI